MVGPCTWEPPAEAPAWLREIEQPIVLVTTSSEFQNDARLVSCALQAPARDDLHVVATLPAQDADAVAVSTNAHVGGFMPTPRC